jgi:formiminotetrahydrofolate cyclodeaminase
VTLATAAAMVVMTARFSDAQLEDAAELASIGDGVRNEALHLADEDGRAYAPVLEAMRADHPSDEARRAAIAAALDGANEVPVTVVVRAARIGELAARLAAEGNRNLHADALSGLHLAVAAARTGLRIVRDNTALGGLDGGRVRDLEAVTAQLEALASDAGARVVEL